LRSTVNLKLSRYYPPSGTANIICRLSVRVRVRRQDLTSTWVSGGSGAPDDHRHYPVVVEPTVSGLAPSDVLFITSDQSENNTVPLVPFIPSLPHCPLVIFFFWGGGEPSGNTISRYYGSRCRYCLPVKVFRLHYCSLKYRIGELKAWSKQWVLRRRRNM